MIISEQHRGPKKPEDKRKSPEDKQHASEGYARSANPQQSVKIGEEAPQNSDDKSTRR